MDILGERWVAPRTLQQFLLDRDMVFSILPAWIRSHLSQLNTLNISVKEVRQEDLDILGSLPGLSELALWTCRQSRLLLITADGFHCLKFFVLRSDSPGQVVVQPGAMPKLQDVELDVSLKEEAAGNVNGGVSFHLNMGNLPSFFQMASVFLYRSGVTVPEAKKEMAALDKALSTHPLRPRFQIGFRPEIPRGT
jgi:hypothetical protein